MASGTVECICLYCSAHFFRQPNQVARGENKFCSVPCKRAAHVKSPAQRLWEKVDQSGGHDACWPYATVKEGKHAVIGFDTGGQQWKGMGAHVLAYTLTNGPIAKGMVVRHTCDNPRCCNPRHLILGTYRQNRQDMEQRHRGTHGPYHRPNAKVTPDIVQAIRQIGNSMPKKDIAAKFSLTYQTTYDILTYHTWVDIEP
jgi:hypothetical protein